jgi:inositol 1,4,5-triphosphate receptor type 3
LTALFPLPLQLAATLILGVFVIFFFTMIIFQYHPQDMRFRECDDLLHCFQAVTGLGMRNGGGIGDYYQNTGNPMGWRFLLDFMFYLVVLVVLLNIIFGIIIDTFSELRTDKKERMWDTTQSKPLY